MEEEGSRIYVTHVNTTGNSGSATSGTSETVLRRGEHVKNLTCNEYDESSRKQCFKPFTDSNPNQKKIMEICDEATKGATPNSNIRVVDRPRSENKCRIGYLKFRKQNQKWSGSGCIWVHGSSCGRVQVSGSGRIHGTGCSRMSGPEFLLHGLARRLLLGVLLLQLITDGLAEVRPTASGW